MGRIANYSNTQKYSDKKSFDGKPVEEGKVLVPFKKEDMNLMPGEYIYDNFTTFHLGEFKIVVGFMAISEGYFASYMQEFWDKLNKELEAGREGRCVIVKNADGTDKLLPFSQVMCIILVQKCDTFCTFIYPAVHTLIPQLYGINQSFLSAFWTIKGIILQNSVLPNFITGFAPTNRTQYPFAFHHN